MSDETTLLPCPFCEKTDTLKITKSNVKHATPDNYFVVCDVRLGGCGASCGTQRTEAEAIVAWNTRTHGTLTAEQVKDAVLENFEEMHETNYDCWKPSKFDWQAIADELNAELGSGTCEPNWVLQGKTQTQEFWRCECGNCGYEFGVEDRSSFPFEITIDEVDVPNFCPNCGKRIRKAVGR